jgi:hypothetical protein
MSKHLKLRRHWRRARRLSTGSVSRVLDAAVRIVVLAG